jgi:hypothetical protein
MGLSESARCEARGFVHFLPMCPEPIEGAPGTSAGAVLSLSKGAILSAPAGAVLSLSKGAILSAPAGAVLSLSKGSARIASVIDDRAQRLHCIDGVGLRSRLVGPITQHSGKSQRHPAGISR